jgi:hypothetical protein
MYNFSLYIHAPLTIQFHAPTRQILYTRKANAPPRICSSFATACIIVSCLRRASVSSISSPLRPKGRNGLDTAPWSGAPNQSMVGGPLSHSAIKRGWGPRLAERGSPRRHIHPTPQTLTDRGSTGAAGSTATAAAEALFVDLAHPVPPPDPRPHRTRSRHPRAATATSTSSRGRPCDPDPRDGFRLRAPVQPRWSAPPCHPLLPFLVVLDAVDLDLGGRVVYLFSLRPTKTVHIAFKICPTKSVLLARIKCSSH